MCAQGTEQRQLILALSMDGTLSPHSRGGAAPEAEPGTIVCTAVLGGLPIAKYVFMVPCFRLCPAHSLILLVLYCWPSTCSHLSGIYIPYFSDPLK